MIKVTVKTLDSRNHQFEVEETLTVTEFKDHIAQTVDIPAARQRIIYCGRVLREDAKLSDYDLNDKVVHLVQTVPPNPGPRIHRSLTPPPDLNRARGGFRGFDRVGNTVYMGMSPVTIPPSILDPQQMIPPRATHTLSSSRLNVARRMLRHAENVIRQLENPNGEEPPVQPEESNEEEMTPIIEARVIVPTNPNQPIDGTAILNAVQNSIFPPSSIVNMPTNASTTATQGTTSRDSLRTSASENSSAEGIGTDSSHTDPQSPPRLRCRGTQMAALLSTLNQLQARYAPFLARYQDFMQNDPEVPPEELEETNQMLNRVSQVMHFLGHAYHSLSDIIILPSNPAPRPLLCRPILIQPPAMVPAGIPIQLEAQINLTPDRPVATSSSTTATSSTGTTTNPTMVGASEAANATESPSQPSQQAQPSITLQPGFVGIPLVPASMRVFTTPVEIRPLRNAAPRRPPNNNNVSAGGARNPQPTLSNPLGIFNNIRVRSQVSADVAPASNGANVLLAQGSPTIGTNGRELEFVMDVTPEDLRGGNLIQSLMQIVGNQLGDTLAQVQAVRGGAAPNQPQADGQAAQQPSQARSTQTNPTAGAQPRAATRPHVHMTQQAVQGGFDPFLHCYSHHVCQSRPQRVSESTMQLLGLLPDFALQIVTVEPQQQASRTPTDAGTAPPPPTQTLAEREAAAARIRAHLASVLDAANARVRQRASQQVTDPAVAPPNESAPPAGAAPPRSSNPSPTARASADLINLVLGLVERNSDYVGPSLNVLVQNLTQAPYVQGEHLLIDLIMLVFGQLQFSDFMAMVTGSWSPLYRQMPRIQRFFLEQVCRNDVSDAGIAQATERILAELNPVIAALETLPTRENINMGRTALHYIRENVPTIIRQAIGEGEDEAATFFGSILTLVRELFALTIRCCANGQESLVTMCNQILQLSTVLSPAGGLSEAQRSALWSINTLLSAYFQQLGAEEVGLDRYLVRNEPVEIPAEHQATVQEPVESMEVDAASPPDAEPPLADETEPLPNVIWGAEQWHAQTPEEWVPLISRDIQRQRKQSAQPPFSDAYISGMPSKRRKLISNTKPQGSVSQTISESLRQVVTNAGLAAAAPLDAVAEAAGESSEIQSAYGSLLQSTVQANLSANQDFNPERYPNAAAYFRESPPQ
ncbi:hypothetical protein HUJ04_001114 [Dendroctonus ponderosae]|nr:hypothetical protein HUJ04_001114 [Dendroctonus ponderosae]